MSQLISERPRVQITYQETSQLTSQRIRGRSSTTATSYGASCENHKRLETFNYYQKVLRPRRLSNPISDPVNMNLVSKYAITNRKTSKAN